MSNKRFLVQNIATVGRQQTAETGDIPGLVEITFYTILEAPDIEKVRDLLVIYADPAFKTRVQSINELGDTVSSDELYALFKPSEIIKEI